MKPEFVLAFGVTMFFVMLSIIFSEKKWSIVTWAVAVLALFTMVMIFGFDRVHAQGFEIPQTTFVQTCYTPTEEGVNVTWGYTSTGGMHYMGSGYDFVTEQGSFPDKFVTSVTPYSVPLGLGYYTTPEDYDVPTSYIDFDLTHILPCAMVESPAPINTPEPYWPVSTPEVQPSGVTCVVSYPSLSLICY